MYWVIGILGLGIAGLSSKVMLDYLNRPGPTRPLLALATILGMYTGVGMSLYGIGLIS
jgi:xanthosine utilization system XapX-like protein